MSIPYKEIRKIVRFKLKDNNEVAYSDYEIKMAVNEVIRYLSISQALNNSDFLNKGYSYDCHDVDYACCGVELPEDFVTLVGVRDYKGLLLEPCDSTQHPRRWQYKISGDRLYCGAPSFTMMYKASLQEIDEEDDEVELPNVFKDMIVQLAILVLNQADSDAMHAAADIAMDQLVPRRRYRNAHIKMPFTIGGTRC